MADSTLTSTNRVASAVSTWHFAFAAATAVLVTVGTSILCAHFGRSNKSPEGIQRAAERLRDLPDQIDDWHAEGVEKLGATAEAILECRGYVARRYVHQKTGENIGLLLLLGPAGPISVHTPEICYAGRDLVMQGTRQHVAIETHDGTAELWFAKFRSRDVSGTDMNVIYGWSPGDRWSAPDDARFAFVGRPYLYKVQISAVASPEAGDAAVDTCRHFLKSFLPVVRQHMLIGN